MNSEFTIIRVLNVSKTKRPPCSYIYRNCIPYKTTVSEIVHSCNTQIVFCCFVSPIFFLMNSVAVICVRPCLFQQFLIKSAVTRNHGTALLSFSIREKITWPQDIRTGNGPSHRREYRNKNLYHIQPI